MTFYRCVLCGSVVNWWDIHDGTGCPNCGQRRISPTNLNVWEKLKQIVKHPKVWSWPNE